MGVDEALLESVSRTGRPCLRFYRWSRPTLSLGYFQRLGQRDEHAASHAAAVVRRTTGGGAILHDHELTYSLVVPINDRWSADHNGLYRRVHQALVEWLARRGAGQVRLHPGESRGSAEPFLCFLRRSDGDVELQGYKVVGSAQRRSRSALLQHGSILLRQSSLAPELLGIQDLLSQRNSDDESLVDQLRQVVIDSVDWGWSGSELDAQEQEAAEKWQTERFSEPGWTARR